MSDSRGCLLGWLAEQIKADLCGNPDSIITHIAPIFEATEGALSFLSNPKYKQFLHQTKASAVLVTADQADECPVDKLICDDPYLAYARISHLFEFRKGETKGVHSQAWIESPELLNSGVSVGPRAVIREGAKIGQGSVIYGGSYIGRDVVIGEETIVYPNATIMDNSVIGNRCVFQAGSTIGGDGFGFARGPEKWEKIAQLGRVVIGDDVEIGSGSTVDCGALGDTVIESGVKIDNQIQIAHNVRIGEGTAIASGTAIAGSARIGKNCTIAGMVGIVGHIEICDGVHITGKTMISRSIDEPGVYSSGLHALPDSQWKKSQARFRDLDGLVKRVRKLEKMLGEIKQEE